MDMIACLARIGYRVNAARLDGGAGHSPECAGETHQGAKNHQGG